MSDQLRKANDMLTVTDDFEETAEKHDNLSSILLTCDNCDASEMECQKSALQLAEVFAERKVNVEKDVSVINARSYCDFKRIAYRV